MKDLLPFNTTTEENEKKKKRQFNIAIALLLLLGAYSAYEAILMRFSDFNKFAVLILFYSITQVALPFLYFFAALFLKSETKAVLWLQIVNTIMATFQFILRSASMWIVLRLDTAPISTFIFPCSLIIILLAMNYMATLLIWKLTKKASLE